MKRSLLTAILGVATAVTALGQGHILVSNYINVPYAQIYWANGAEAGQALTGTSGVQFQMFYGVGVQSSFGSLTPGLTFGIDGVVAYDPSAGHGPGGYFTGVDQILPSWAAGQTYTFGYQVITPGYSGASALWQEQANIVSTAFSPLNSASVGMAVSIVPEPTSLALAGLGAAALLIFRRRQ
jgi:hypothetical protein